MQENEFEKQLKNLMGDLDLKPSDAVWDKVRQKLNDRRRRVLPFFILLFAGLLIAGYFLYQNSVQQNKISNTTINSKKEIDRNKIYTDSLKKSAKTIQQENKPAQAENKAAFKNQATNNSEVYGLHSYKKQDRSIITNQNISLTKENFIPQKKQPLQPTEINPQLQLPAQFYNDKTNNITIKNAPVYPDTLLVNTSNEPAKNIIQQDLTANNDNKNITQQDSISVAQNITDTSYKTKTKKPTITNNKLSNWQWGITALYGRSNLVTAITDLNKSRPSSALNNNGGYSNLTSNNKIYTSSEAYNIGGVVEKKIFKNGLISVGLNYTHLSVKSTTNKKVDSALYFLYDNGSQLMVPNYYNPGSLLIYKSTYNFIEMPVNFQQDIFRKNKIALSYNAGISVRELLNSKALIYDRYSNVYYSSNSLLNKTQLQFLAGLNLNFKTSNNSSIFVGPQFSYSLSSLTKNTNISSFHFITYGLQAGILLHKK